MTNHVHDTDNGVSAGGLGDKKSHYTALLVGVIIGTMASSLVLVAVAISLSTGS